MRLPVAVRYSLMQIPGALLLAAGLYFMVGRDWIPWPVAVVILVVWVGKDAAMYPLYRHALKEGPPVGTRALVGRRARAETDIDPAGRVRVQGERWRARLASSTPVAAGASVRIVGAWGLTLLVEPLSPSEAADAPGSGYRSSSG